MRASSLMAVVFLAFAVLLGLIAYAYLTSPPSTSGATSTQAATTATATAVTSALTPNSSLAIGFIAAVNSYRESAGEPPLAYCPWLSAYAEVRFRDMIENYSITHYLFYQDLHRYLGQYYGLIVGEEVFYPNTTNATALAEAVRLLAPEHWAELINGTFRYWGLYMGRGPTYVIEGSCPVREFMAPNISIPHVLESYRCNYTVENATWLVIELSNWCNETHLKAYSDYGLYLTRGSVVQLQFSVPWPWSEVNVSVSSTGPVCAALYQQGSYQPAYRTCGAYIELLENLTQGSFTLSVSDKSNGPVVAEVNVTLQYPIRPQLP